MSLRRLAVLLRYLPPGSATWAAVHGVPVGWGTTEFLLADLFQAFTGEEHPHRPKASAAADASRDLVARLRAQRDRLQSAPTPAP